MFLAGGPAFNLTRLLALLLNQGSLVCLDEPNFREVPAGTPRNPFSMAKHTCSFKSFQKREMKRITKKHSSISQKMSNA
jgi:hypothetical protein